VGFGSIAGGLLGGSSSGPLLVAMMRSRTVEDRIIDRFNLKKVYRIALRARLEVKTAISLEPKTGIVVLSVTDSDPQRAAGMARAYVQELEVLMAQLNISSAHRERVFLQDQLQVVTVDMETAEKELSEFASKNGAMDITEQGRVMIECRKNTRGTDRRRITSGRGPRDLHREQPTRTFFRSARLRTRQSKTAVAWDV
jgi:hypothetical protein